MTLLAPLGRRNLLGWAGLLLLVLCTLAPVASAAPLTGSAFDTGDGDQADMIGLDWQGAAASGRVKASPDANDDCFVGGVKELSPNQWAFNRSAGGCTPGKSNLRVAFANAETLPATTVGHFAFFRNDTTGNSFLTFELNQAASTWTNATGTTIPCRSDGDVLLSFEIGGSSLTSALYKWNGDGSGPASCPDGAAGTFTGSGAIPAGRFQGTMNASAAIANFVSPGAFGAVFPANAFGEAAVDLPAVLRAMGESSCFGFVQMQVHSRSSSSISSAMIDYTTPVPVSFESCAATGTVYQDTDGDGARGGGEPPLPGFRMFADLDDDGALDPGEPSGLSDQTGFYRILDVPSGTVRIRQAPRAGWSCSQPRPCSYERTIPLNGNSTGNDFGVLGPSSARGTTVDDLDGDGVHDAGEPGLGGIVVYADLDDDGSLDAGEPSGASAADGTWTVTDIPAGTHRLRQVLPGGWTCSLPATCASSQTFTSGSVVEGVGFGAYGPGTIGGRLFEDVDGDGAAMEAGDVALAGRQVFLDEDGDDAFDLGEPQTTSDASGLYAFTGLRPGASTVRVSSPADWTCTRPGASAAACEHPVTLVSAQTATGRDFGFARPATVSGTVFADANANGARDAGEGSLAGFTQWVDLDDDGALDAGEPSATSDGAGAYTITGVPAGSWTLRQAPNGAYACTLPTPCTRALTLASNGAATGQDFGDHVSRSVSGTVFDDADADGAGPEGGEQGVSGWFVYADSDNDGVHDATEPSSRTNSLGAYNLTGLPNGNYRIRIALQSGWTCSAPAGCVATGSIGSGQSDTGMNFAVWGPATISGTVFEDADADGAARETGEPGLSGRVVYVDADGDGARDADEPAATSGPTGSYAITGLSPGTYTVRQVLPGGWTCSRPAPCSHTMSTTSGGLGGRDFGSSTTGSIAGTVYEDADADGAPRESGEDALTGRTVFLDADADGVRDDGEAATTTDVSGAYAFAGLAPGTYRVVHQVVAGWRISAPASPHVVTVTSAATVTGRDVATHTTGVISGTAFEDADFDGSARETGDPSLGGRVMWIDTDADAEKDAGEPEATTDDSGAYTFAGLAPGAYTIRPVLPAGWACSSPAACSASATVASRGSAAGRDFGSYRGASLSGTVFEDADADGAARETGEQGMAGRRVFLDADADGTRGAAEPTTLTGADGTYAFTGITARVWRVRVELPARFTCDSPQPCERELALTSGSDHPGQDFGVHTTGSIAGHLFTDRDADGGAQVFGENDQPERTVFLDADDDGALDEGERTATTDDRGDYAFTGLEPGIHRVRQLLPEGWRCSSPDPCVHEVTLTSGQAVTGRTFSSWTTAAVSGMYFEDEDADGEYPEPGEGGVAGRTVYVDLDDSGAVGDGEPVATTAEDGAFSFSGLRPGTYSVRSTTQPSAWTCSYPAPCETTLSVEAGERAQDVDFGTWTDGGVAGTVFRDADGDGGQDATEPGLDGWRVYADVDRDGTPDAGEPSATTGDGGAYALSLAPGEYTIREVAPSGWSCTGTDPCTRAVTVRSGGAITGQDFGNAQATTASGTVFVDGDADGSRDAGEPARSGAVVFVDTDANGTFDAGEPTDTTGADGGYELAVGPGEQIVRLGVPAGFRCDAPDGCAHAPTIVSGGNVRDLDFAIWQPASIRGVVSDDLDGDGTRDAGEPPLPGTTVFVDADGDGGRGDGERQATTGTDGAYAIGDLRPGRHVVRAELPADARCTGLAGCARSLVLAGAETATADLSTWRPATLTGLVFEDADGDGAARETGEPGLAGREVLLDADGDGERDAGEPVALTGEDGSYAISGVAPGSHVVRLVVAEGWRCTRPSPCSASVTTTSGARRTVPDFGAVALAADLGVSIDRTGPDLVAGRRSSWMAAVTNTGPFAATGAVVELLIPDGLRDVTWEAPGGVTCERSGATLSCALGDVPVGGDAQIRIAGLVGPDQAGRELRLAAATDADQPDPDPSDDDDAQAEPPAAIVDLRAAATLPARGTVGDVVELTLEVLAAGPSDADDVTVVTTLPEGLDPVIAELPAGCAADGRLVTCTVPGLAVGETLRRTLRLRVGPAAAGMTLSVPVQARSSAPDPTPADASAEAAVSFVAPDPAPAPAPPPLQDDRRPAAPLVVTAPSPAACASVRAFTVRVRRRDGRRLRGVTMSLAGRPLTVVRRNGRFTARVDLRGLAVGSYALRIRARTADGRTLRGTRTYHTCAPRRPATVPVL